MYSTYVCKYTLYQSARCTVLFVQKRPVGSWSLSRSVSSRSVSQLHITSSSLRHCYYMVLKFNVEGKTWRTQATLSNGSPMSTAGKMSSIGHRSSKGTKYCELIWEADIEKRLLVTRSINYHLISRVVGQSVGWSSSRLSGQHPYTGRISMKCTVVEGMILLLYLKTNNIRKL